MKIKIPDFGPIRKFSSTTNAILLTKSKPVSIFHKGVDPYWPVSGVAKPSHLWPFAVTGDYTDRGASATKADLAAGGTGNAFTSDGLILNGNGWAYAQATPEDLNTLGGQFSIIVAGVFVGFSSEWPVSFWSEDYFIVTDLSIDSESKAWMSFGAAETDFLNLQTNPGLLGIGDPYVIVVTFDAGTVKFYLDGIEKDLTITGSGGTVIAIPAIDKPLYIGDFWGAPSETAPINLKLLAITKGVVYGQSAVDAIQNALGS